MNCNVDVIIILILRGKVFLFFYWPQVFSKSGIELTASSPHPLYSSPKSRFYFTSLHFHSIFASPFHYCYNISDGFYPPPPSFFLLDYVYFFLLHPFGYLFPYLSVSPFQLSLTLPFYCLRVQLVFSHPPITSIHLISAIFKIFFPHHHTWRRAKPETSFIEIFSLNLHISHLDH